MYLEYTLFFSYINKLYTKMITLIKKLNKFFYLIKFYLLKFFKLIGI